jgi:TRAP-type C4-dicarboxylate transport system permease small subunit
MLAVVRAYRKALHLLLRAVLGVTLVLLVVLELVEILFRYFFLATLQWSSDVSGLLLLTLGWLGAAHLWLIKNHLTVDLFAGRNLQLQRKLRMLPDVLMLMAAMWLLPVVVQTMRIYDSMVMPALNAPASIKFIPTVVSLPLLLSAAVVNLVSHYYSSIDADGSGKVMQ